MITLRITTIEDVNALTAIQQNAFLPLYEKYHDAGNPCLRDERDILCRLNNPKFLYLTILSDEKIVGAILYRIKGSTPFVKNLRWGKYYLGRVYISPEYQNKGIATEAILQSENFLKKPRKLYVDFPEDLDKNRKCYTKCGYRDTGKRLETEPGLILACFEKRI
ncbi:MAG: GNAT family N-acetyltransferase [Acutalibacteraceae bacterium]|nr:GNAT family N-acetyltransferase [Acutalibacteraceae bacterium]